MSLQDWKELPPPNSGADEAVKAWDYWYANIPEDIRRKLSLHDFKRLGDLLVEAFTRGNSNGGRG